MSSTEDALLDHFPLRVAAPALRKFQPPQGRFDPAGAWRNHYGVWTIGQRGMGRVGAVTLARRPADGDTFVLSVDYHKQFGGGTSGRVSARMTCRTDRLATPVQWEARYESRDKAGKLLPLAAITRKGEIGGWSVVVSDTKSKRALPIQDAWTNNWALFEAVGRLPREDFGLQKFTLLDDFDQVKPNQTLRYRQTTKAKLGGKDVVKYRRTKLDKGEIRSPYRVREGGREITLYAYDHIGRGVVPWVYWVDETGRLVWAISGLEAYIWEPPADPAATGKEVRS